MMTSKLNPALTALAAGLLLAIGALHGSGYASVSTSLRESELSAFLKEVLPFLYLYPTALMVILAAVVLSSLRLKEGRAAVLYVVAAIAAPNCALGFMLGGAIPGIVLLLVAGLVLVLARLAKHNATNPPS